MQTSRVFTLLGTGLLVMQLRAAGTPQSEASSSSQAPAAANSEILQELRERIAKQEEQIKRLQQAVDEQRTMLDKALAASEPTAGSQTATAADRSANEPVSIVPALNVARPHGLVPARAGQNLQSSNPSPLGIRIGGTTFTPLGFVDFTWFGRSTNVGSGLGTNFGAIPFNNSTAAHLSENNLSTQNSRIGFRVDSEV